MANCSESFPYTSILFPEIDEDAFFIVSAVIGSIFLVLNLLNFAEELWFLCRYNSNAPARNYTTYILILFPALSSCCVMGLLVPRSTLFMELTTSTLRAIAIFVYTRILIGYFGGEDKLLAEMTDLPITFRTPPCCCCFACIKPSIISSKTFRVINTLCVQLVIIRPITMLILFLLWVDNRYELTDKASTSNPGTYFQIINIASLLLSIWAAIVLTKAVKCKLPNRRIPAKFFSVQLTMVFSDAQRSILTILASSDVIDCVGTRGPMVLAYRYHYGLLVLETFLLSLLARYAYRFEDPPYFEKMEGQVDDKN